MHMPASKLPRLVCCACFLCLPILGCPALIAHARVLKGSARRPTTCGLPAYVPPWLVACCLMPASPPARHAANLPARQPTARQPATLLACAPACVLACLPACLPTCRTASIPAGPGPSCLASCLPACQPLSCLHSCLATCLNTWRVVACANTPLCACSMHQLVKPVLRLLRRKPLPLHLHRQWRWLSMHVVLDGEWRGMWVWVFECGVWEVGGWA